MNRNISWLRASGLGVHVDAVLAGDLIPYPPDSQVFAPGTAGGEPPQWMPAARQLSDERRAAAAVWQLAAAGAAALHDVVPNAHVVYGTGGWTQAPGWTRLKTTVARTPYRVLAEPELTALGAAHLGLPGPIAPLVQHTAITGGRR